MAPTPQEEATRIAAVYSAMENEELERIGASGDELSTIAYQALLAESRKRGLAITIAPPPGEDVLEFHPTVTLRQFRDLPDALLAKGSLESAGIEAYLIDDNMIRMDWFISNLLGGIKLKVRPEDVAVALEILDLPIPATFEVEGIGIVDQPKCPQCDSLEANFLEPNQTWTCGACGHVWNEAATGPGPQL